METAETQLTQTRVPLDEAAEAFGRRDASGRIPIVVLPERASRINRQLLLAAGVILAAGLGVWLLADRFGLLLVCIGVAVALTVVGVNQAFLVPVPEGTQALLGRRGSYLRTIGAGVQVVVPSIAVSHLVTRREIPFGVQVADAPTADGVRATVDCLVTFAITDPYRFVYNISADDFDLVFQAVCQEALRALVRGKPSGQVSDLAGQTMGTLREAIGATVAAYGVEVRTVVITFAQPPGSFVLAEEARQLAEIRRRQVEAEADVEALRLARLEERLQRYPQASQWEWEGTRLEVARALAGNTRAVLQVDNANQIANALVVRDVMQDAAAPPAGGAGGPGTAAAPDAAAAPGAPGADEQEERRPNGTPPPATDLAQPDAAPARTP